MLSFLDSRPSDLPRSITIIPAKISRSNQSSHQGNRRQLDVMHYDDDREDYSSTKTASLIQMIAL